MDYTRIPKGFNIDDKIHQATGVEIVNAGSVMDAYVVVVGRGWRNLRSYYDSREEGNEYHLILEIPGRAGVAVGIGPSFMKALALGIIDASWKDGSLPYFHSEVKIDG